MWDWLPFRRKPKSLGQRGEDYAAKYLRRNGYTIIAKQDQTTMAEIDIVAVKKRTLVFVEVKTRNSAEKGQPEDAVDLAKQKRLTTAALAYLRRHDLFGQCQVRFDVVSIVWPEGAKSPNLRHFEAAFDAVGKFQLDS